MPMPLNCERMLPLDPLVALVLKWRGAADDFRECATHTNVAKNKRELTERAATYDNMARQLADVVTGYTTKAKLDLYNAKGGCDHVLELATDGGVYCRHCTGWRPKF